ncbi:MAG: PAS domain S-box protein, partial [Bacteroidota bacterium]
MLVLQKVGLPIITVYPLATIIIGKIIHDNLERTRYTAKLIASEEKYRRIAENISDVIWTTDSDLNITYISPSIERIVGESVEKYQRRTVAEMFPPDDLLQVLSAVKAEIELEKDPHANRDRSRLIEVETYRADRSTIWVSMNVSILRDQKGNAIGFQGVSRDITQRKQADIELLAAKEKAVVSDQLKTAFLMNMSHEIRTPMNGILGFLYLLEEPDLAEETKKEYIEIMNQSGKRLLNTINDIIEISRIEAGEAEVRYEEVDVAELLEGQVVFFKPEADE